MIDKNSHILITGGTGFLGSYIIRTLINEGYNNIYALKRSTSDTRLVDNIYNKVTWLEGDILDIQKMDAFVRGKDAVIHAAAMVSFKKKDATQLMKINVEGTENVVNLCVHHKVHRLVHLSSVAAVGGKNSTRLISEESNFDLKSKNSIYARSKFLGEKEVWRGIAEGLSAVILNPSLILGAGIWGQSSTQLFKHAYDLSKFYPIGSHGYVDVRDVANAVSLVLQSSTSGERYIINASNHSYKSFLSICAEVMNRPQPRFKISPWMGPMLVSGSLLASAFQKNKSALTRASIQTTMNHVTYDNEKFKSEFQYEFMSFEKSAREAAALYMAAKTQSLDYGLSPLI